jgi:pimeloyl-ACP methyl ester carboxylesterase
VKSARLVRTSVAVVALAAALVGLVLGCGVTDRLLLFPPRGALPDTGGAERGTLPTELGEIEVWRARSKPGIQPIAYVLRFYGNADRADAWVGAEARGLPFAGELWGVNYPGFGGSGGRASLRGVARAAEVAYDALSKVANGRPIVVVGTSMGTTAALHLAAERSVAGVVLQNPPPLRQLIRGRHGWWNLWLLAIPVAWGVPTELDSLANAAKARAPAMFVMAGEDEVVPHDYQLLVRDAYAGPKESWVLPGARHDDPLPPTTTDAIATAMLRFLRR